MFDESFPHRFESIERDDKEAEAILSEEAARLRREKKRPFIALFTRVAERTARACLAPLDLTDLLRGAIFAEPHFVREALLELDALRIRLTGRGVERLIQSQAGDGEANLPAARDALLATGFDASELTDETVRQILDYAPLLKAFHAVAASEPF